jgi:hypothetical protein
MNEKQFKKGEEIVSLAKINATSSYSVISEKFPKEFTYSTNDWDFYMTVLSSCIAVQFLPPKSDDETFTKVYERVTEDLEKMYSTDGNRARVDCENYFERSLGEDFKPEELMFTSGSWVWRNLTRKALEEKDRELMYSIGVLASSPFMIYWD